MELPDLENLPQAQVDAAHAYLSQRLAEYAPTAERRRGVIHDVVLYLEGVFAAAADEWADRLRRSGSLLAIQADPTLATDEIVDGVLSNFGADRKAGSRATGRVVIQIAALVPSNVAAGTVFAAQGRTFETAQAFAGRVSAAAVVSPTDRLIRPLGDGTFAYVVDVAAAADGAAGMLRRGARLEPQTLIPGLVAAYAESDFVGGLNAESNAELVARQREGIAGKNPSNRVTLAAMIRQDARFARVVGLSAVGFGDPEQTRYHSILPVAFGGRLDVYARTQPLPQTVRLEVTATLVRQTTGGGVWQFGLGRDDAPGFYDVVQVVKSGESELSRTGYEVTGLERQLDLTAAAGEFVPDLTTPAEAAFTRYQAGVVQFLDTDTGADAVVGATAAYVAFVRAVPLVADLQAFLADRDRRPGGGDVVVKAPVPCDVRLTFAVVRPSGQADPDVAAMAAALADEVNRAGFPGRLPASALQAVAHRFLAAGQATGPLDLWGRITLPGGGLRYLRNATALEVPDLPAQGVTGRTVAFYLDPADVSITVTVKDVPAV